MRYVSGRIEPGGAVVDVMIGVPGVRAELLRKHAFPVPEPVFVRALIDTGASLSGFAPRVFQGLDCAPSTRWRSTPRPHPPVHPTPVTATWCRWDSSPEVATIRSPTRTSLPPIAGSRTRASKP